jgi:hypothetical protein
MRQTNERFPCKNRCPHFPTQGKFFMQQFLSGWGFGFLSGLCILTAGYFYAGKKVNAREV